MVISLSSQPVHTAVIATTEYKIIQKPILTAGAPTASPAAIVQMDFMIPKRVNRGLIAEENAQRVYLVQMALLTMVKSELIVEVIVKVALPVLMESSMGKR